MINIDGIRYPAPVPGTRIVPFEQAWRDDAVALAAAGTARLRAAVPALPAAVATTGGLAPLVGGLLGEGRALAAVRDGRLVGYLGWITLEGFRGTGRRAAYCPVWGFAAAAGEGAALLAALSREASGPWTAAGCGAHVITLPAHEPAIVLAGAYLGFGVTVIDAIRMIGDLPPRGRRAGTEVRRAGPADLDAVLALEADHHRYYTAPPVLMAGDPPGREEVAGALAGRSGGYWLAFEDGEPAGFVRMDAEVDGATWIVRSPTTVGVHRAHVRQDRRGRGLGTALLEAALGHYAGLGRDRCSVDFESFNPLARAFWLRSFTPVCASLVRYPEAVPVGR